MKKLAPVETNFALRVKHFFRKKVIAVCVANPRNFLLWHTPKNLQCVAKLFSTPQVFSMYELRVISFN